MHVLANSAHAPAARFVRCLHTVGVLLSTQTMTIEKRWEEKVL